MNRFFLIFSVALSSGLAFADAECEKRIRDTGMIVLPKDPEIICKQKPTRETQDCLIEVLTKTKGKLRNQDLLEVFGVCKADPRQPVRDCMVRNLEKPWNDAEYKPAREVGKRCLLSRKEVLRRASPPPAQKPAQAATPATKNKSR